MLKLLLPILLLIFSLVSGNSTFGFEGKGQDCSKCHKLSQEEARDLLKFPPEVKILEIKLSPLKTVWEIDFESGTQRGLTYIDLSKKYFILGRLFFIEEKRDLTEERMIELNKVDVSQIPLDDALVMGDGKAKIRVIVFDDPD